MAEFINTIDRLGDDAVIDSIIDRTITEFADDTLQTIAGYAFRGCAALTEVNLPSLTTIGYQETFAYTNITAICLPAMKHLAGGSLRGMTKLITADLPAAELIDGYSVYQCSALKNVLLRNNTVCVISNNAFMTYITSTYNPHIRVFVPRALLEEYRVATNWVEYADQLYPLEENTVDGTVTGELGMGTIQYNLTGVKTSNADVDAVGSYNTTLTAFNSYIIQEVSITMGGVDITSQVYNAVTGEVNIHNITGEIVIAATAERDPNAPANILDGVEFILGYIDNNGSINTTSTGDTRTNQFDISEYAGMSIVVNLVDVKSNPAYNRIVYYNENNSVVGSTQGAASGTNVTIESTVPATAVYAAISVNKSSGFSAIDITCYGEQIGYIEYAS